MIVCLCKAVSDREIRTAIRRGAGTVREVRQACGAGAVCGSCVCDLRDLLDRERTGHDQAPPRLLSK